MREKYKRAMTASVHQVLVFPGRTIASSSGISQKAAFRSVPEPVRRNARQSRMLHALILKDTGASAKTSPKIIPDETVRLRWFVEERYLPMRRELGAPAYRKINTFEIKHYLVVHFGRIPLNRLETFRTPGLAHQARNQVLPVRSSPLHQHSVHPADGEKAEVPRNRSRGRRNHATDRACREGPTTPVSLRPPHEQGGVAAEGIPSVDR
jgi:hypothetical protein